MQIRDYLSEMDRGKFFTRPDHKWRSPLDPEAEDLSRALDTVSEVMLDGDTPALFNLGALVHYRSGDTIHAEEISHKLADLAISMSHKTGEMRWLYHVLQPFINLIRLDAAQLRCNDARNKVHNLEMFVSGQRNLVMGCNEVSPSLLELAPPNNEDVLAVCKNACVGESIRALLLCKDYQGAIQYSETQLSEKASYLSTHNKLLLQEGAARGYLGLARPDRALEAISVFHKLCADAGAVYVGSYDIVAQAYLAMSKAESARNVVDRVVKYLLRVSGTVKDVHKPAFCQTLLSFAGVGRELDDDVMVNDLCVCVRQALAGEIDEVVEAKLMVLKHSPKVSEEVFEESVNVVRRMSFGLERAITAEYLGVVASVDGARDTLKRFGRCGYVRDVDSGWKSSVRSQLERLRHSIDNVWAENSDGTYIVPKTLLLQIGPDH